MNALKLFQECLKHPGELVDDFYCYDDLIISKNPNYPKTPIMETWIKVRERITASKVALEDGNQSTYDLCVKELDHLLTSRDYTNFLEFTSFFPVMDVSFSMYCGLSMKERIRFLDIMLRSFIDKRYNIYNEHGYSASTIQVRKDFEKHKSQGNFANEKFRNLLEQFDYREAPVETGQGHSVSLMMQQEEIL